MHFKLAQHYVQWKMQLNFFVRIIRNEQPWKNFSIMTRINKLFRANIFVRLISLQLSVWHKIVLVFL